ncbi:MAG: hypothetical protein H6711_03400 [Myxococcales bacterium]|nr:hypothetical protein [Myxococcales bacterium]
MRSRQIQRWGRAIVLCGWAWTSAASAATAVAPSTDAREEARGLLSASSIEVLVAASSRPDRFAEAASLAEREVERVGAGPEARALLERALLLRLGLGDADAARRDVDLAWALFGSDEPAWVAGLAWALRELATTEEARLRHAEDYLRHFGDEGGVDRRLVAEVTVADDRWRRSCRRGDTLGLCVAAAASGGERCGPASARPVKRERRLAADALARYERVRRFRWESSPRAEERLLDAIPEPEARRRAELRDALERAELALLDARFEALLAIALPTDLDFYADPEPCERAHVTCRPAQAKPRDPALPEWAQVERRAIDPAACTRERARCRRRWEEAEDSRVRLRRALKEIDAQSVTLYQGYRALIARKASPRGMIQAVLRRGQLLLHVSALLGGAALPRGLRLNPEAREAHCKVMADAGAPYRAAAVEALVECVIRSSVLGCWTDASDGCEDALARLEPSRYPALREFVGAPSPADDEVVAPRAVGVQLATPAATPR